MSTDSDTGPEGEPVRLLPTDQRDMTPSAVLWAKVVLKALRAFPRAQMYRPARESLTAVVWTLAAAADFNNTISPDLRAPVLAREAGVGERVWQKRTAWLREYGWLEHGQYGVQDGWRLRTAETL
jgi:hypothetical protein